MCFSCATLTLLCLFDAYFMQQGTVDKQLPPDASLEQNFDQLSPDDKKAEMIKVMGYTTSALFLFSVYVLVASPSKVKFKHFPQYLC